MRDDPSDNPPDDDEGLSAFAELRSALSEVLDAFADEHALGDADLSFLLVDAALSHRTFAYGGRTGQPSEGGLKLDLDRFTREVSDLVREAKKEAREIVRGLVEMAAETNNDHAGT